MNKSKSRGRQCLLDIFPKAKYIFPLILSVFISGCSLNTLVPLSYQIEASREINPDDYQNSLPVQLKLYQLKDMEKFQQATFRQLWKVDRKVLADQLVSVNSITVSPNEKIAFKQDRKEGTKYIGVVALFRHPKLGVWRSYKPVDSQPTSLILPMQIIIKGNNVRIK